MPSRLAAPKSISSAFIRTVEQSYGVIVHWVETVNHTVRLHTDRGQYELVSSAVSPEQLSFTLAALNHLQRQDFHQLLKVSIPKTGEYGISQDGQWFYLVQAGGGHEANFLHAGEREQAMKTLAAFHQCSKEFYFEYNEQLQFPEWRTAFLADLEKLSILLAERGQTRADTLIWEGAQKAVEGVLSSTYDRVQEQEAARLGFIHGETRAANFLIEDQSYLKLPATLTLRRDLRVYDIVCCLQGVMQQTKWDADIGSSLLRSYEMQASLSKEEKQLIAYWILFPWALMEESVQRSSAEAALSEERLEYRMARECALAGRRIQFANALLE
ncbi:MAG: hypothetical protein JWN30_1589 [Bacilli bacterium]|nr:hypothetical protein [Bacilli bacterium]